MGSAHRVVSLLLLIIAQGITATQALGGGQMVQIADPISVFSPLKTTLSKLYPIEHWTMSTNSDAMHPLAPRFCWQFFRPDPEILGRLGEAIRNYQGSVNWLIGPPAPNAPICLVAAKRGSNQFVGYPPLSEAAEQQSGPTQEFIDKALADVPKLRSYLERQLGLEQLPAKSFDPGLIAPPDPPSLVAPPVDFVERGMHVAWIINGGRTESREVVGTSSDDRRMLHFSITTKEWQLIEAEILGGTTTSRVAGLGHEAFPLLAKIQESESVYFRGAEVAALRQECLRARASTLTPLAIRGMDKLILICNWAQHGAGDILLRAP